MAELNDAERKLLDEMGGAGGFGIELVEIRIIRQSDLKGLFGKKLTLEDLENYRSQAKKVFASSSELVSDHGRRYSRGYSLMKERLRTSEDLSLRTLTNEIGKGPVVASGIMLLSGFPLEIDGNSVIAYDPAYRC